MGIRLKKAFISNNATGKQDIVIELANNDFPNSGINKVENHFTLPTVLGKIDDGILRWDAIKDAKEYCIYKNGTILKKTTETQHPIENENYASYMVSAIDDKGYEGFACEPLVFAKNVQIIEIENFAPTSKLAYSNYSGNGFVELTLEKNREITLTVEVDNTSMYVLDFKYSNGSGRWNTNNKCAIRSLNVNENYEGVIVMPQRGLDEWSDWGFSNSRKVHLNSGKNKIKIHFEDWNNNMNVDVNTAMLDYLRVTSIE